MSTEHKGLPVAGYQPQSDQKVTFVNFNKRLEESILRQLDGFKQMSEIDQRWLAIGRTAIEQGFMAVNRSIFQPTRVQLDGDT